MRQDQIAHRFRLTPNPLPKHLIENLVTEIVDEFVQQLPMRIMDEETARNRFAINADVG
jgi:hypothetical protein